MAWTSPMTAVANSAFTAAQFNANVRDNLNETAPAKATTSGSLFVGTGTNAIAERFPSVDTVSASEDTSSTSYTDLATNGPELTLTTGTKAIVFIHCAISNDTTGVFSLASFETSGASSISATDTIAVGFRITNANDEDFASGAFMLDILTAGSNTFTMKYRVNNTSTGSFRHRRLAVIPL